MAVKSKIVLFGSNMDTQEAVQNVLAEDESLVLDHVVSTLPELVDYLETGGTIEVLLDAGTDPDTLVTRLGPVIEEFPKTRFVLLCNELDERLIFRAMESGVRYALTKESLGNGELLDELRRLAQNNQQTEQGIICTFMAGSGGCGSTIVACNLTNELGLKTGNPALYIDLDWYYGGGTNYLGVHHQYTLPDILARDKIDEHLVRSSTVTYSDTLHILPSPASAGAADDINVNRLLNILNICKLIYPYIIIDAPRLPRHAAVALSQASALDLLIFQLDIKSIETVREIRNGLVREGIPDRKMEFLLTRHRWWRNPLSVSEAKEALEIDDLLRIKEHYKHAIRSINYGNLLADSARHSRFRRSILEVADKVENKRDSVRKKGKTHVQNR